MKFWKMNLKIDEREKIVSVEAYVDIPMKLPELNSDFVEAIGHVRNSKAGKKLRKSILQLGRDIDFHSQVECWHEVSAEPA